MKSAMQELIEMIDNGIYNKNELIKTFWDTGSEIGNGIKYLKQVKEIIQTQLLEKEKQQIIDAFENGRNNVYGKTAFLIKSGEYYYNQTFKP